MPLSIQSSLFQHYLCTISVLRLLGDKDVGKAVVVCITENRVSYCEEEIVLLYLVDIRNRAAIRIACQYETGSVTSEYKFRFGKIGEVADGKFVDKQIKQIVA